MSKTALVQKKAENRLVAAYEALVASGRIQDDPAQRGVLHELAALSDTLTRHKKRRLLSRQRKEVLCGFYLYGSVGGGKSMLMDLFYHQLSIKAKRREHFHAFMQEVHIRLDSIRKKAKGNPISALARVLAKEITILCLDELQVTDITDAMILGRLFEALFKEGVTLVATSNRAPEDLYKDGLQRERFLPFIALLKTRLRIMALESGTDYRLTLAQHLSTLYFTPLGKEADLFLKKTFTALTNGAKPVSRTLHVQGRSLLIQKTHGGIVWMGFPELCEASLGAGDYLEIARSFSVLLLSGIPRMGQDQRNEAWRFVTLIDALYEHGVMLICTAAASPQELYTGNDGSFEFARTASRLMEMQSGQYIHSEHKG